MNFSNQQQSRKLRFSQRALDSLPDHPEESRSANQEHSDSEVTGLRLFVGKSKNGKGSGRKTYHFRYRHNGRKRVIRIGEHPSCTVADARKLANDCKQMIANGLDPLEERDRKQNAFTFMEFAEQEFLPWAKEHKKSWHDDELKLSADMIPTFGRMPLNSITVRDIGQYLSKIKARTSGSTANRHWSVLSKLFSMAVQFQIIQVNPCRLVKKYAESSGRERYLSKPELSRFLSALDSYGDNTSAWLCRFLLFSGLRKGEAVRIRFADIDFESDTLLIPISKNGKSRRVTLNSLAMEVVRKMRTLQAAGNPYVFPGGTPGQHLKWPKRVFESVREEAGIPDLRLHDLRHSFASLSIQAGATLYDVQHLLGHSSPQMTIRYAHIDDDQARRASEGAASKICDALA